MDSSWNPAGDFIKALCVLVFFLLVLVVGLSAAVIWLVTH